MDNIMKNFVAKIIAAGLVLGFSTFVHAEATPPAPPQAGEEIIINVQSESVNGELVCTPDQCGVECAETWKTDRNTEKFVQCGTACAQSPICKWNGVPVRDVLKEGYAEAKEKLSAKLQSKFGAGQAPPFVVPESSSSNPSSNNPPSAGESDGEHGIAAPPTL